MTPANPTPARADKITHAEIVAIFGATMPMEAVEVIDDWAGTTDDLRQELRRIAAARAPAPELQGAVEPVLWGVMNPHTLNVSSRAFKVREAADAYARRHTDNYTSFVVIPLFGPDALDALRAPEAVGMPGELREALAVKAIQYLSDHENIDWPEVKCREILAEAHKPHSGDCTKKPWTCLRCVAEEAYRFADATLPILSRLPGRGESEGWRPIESAPKDGTHFIGYGPAPGDGDLEARETYWQFFSEGSQARKWFDRGEGPSGQWRWSEPLHNWGSSWKPTHWRPLPDPPAAPEPEGEGPTQDCERDDCWHTGTCQGFCAPAGGKGAGS